MSNFEFETGFKDRLLEHLKQVVRDRSPGFSSAGHFFVSPRDIRAGTSPSGAQLEPFHFTVSGTAAHQLDPELCQVPLKDLPTRPPILIFGASTNDTVPGLPWGRRTMAPALPLC